VGCGFRKSVRLGPLRVTASRRGLSASTASAPPCEQEQPTTLDHDRPAQLPELVPERHPDDWAHTVANLSRPHEVPMADGTVARGGPSSQVQDDPGGGDRSDPGRPHGPARALDPLGRAALPARRSRPGPGRRRGAVRLQADNVVPLRRAN